MADNGLSTHQKKAIAALLAQPSTEKAAAAAGISRRQLYRWLSQPEFAQALKNEEGELIRNAGTRLLAGLETALNTLSELAQNAQNEGVRRAAASDWINQAVRVKEFKDFAERLETLEARIEHG